jgi:hypothetical protein
MTTDRNRAYRASLRFALLTGTALISGASASLAASLPGDSAIQDAIAAFENRFRLEHFSLAGC